MIASDANLRAQQRSCPHALRLFRLPFNSSRQGRLGLCGTARDQFGKLLLDELKPCAVYKILNNSG